MNELPAIRHRWITEELLLCGAVTGRQIMQRFKVSDSTALRDCRRVAQRLGHRVHGGLVLTLVQPARRRLHPFSQPVR